MAKKQRRYMGADLEKGFPELKGESVNLILQDGKVYYVKWVRLETDQLIATDGMDRVHHFPLHQIAEVIAEKHA